MTFGDLSTVDWASQSFAEAVGIVLRDTTYDVEEDLVEDGMERLLAGEALVAPSFRAELGEHGGSGRLECPAQSDADGAGERHTPRVVDKMTQMSRTLGRRPIPEEDSATRKLIERGSCSRKFARGPRGGSGAEALVLLEIDCVHGSLEQRGGASGAGGRGGRTLNCAQGGRVGGGGGARGGGAIVGGGGGGAVERVNDAWMSRRFSWIELRR